MDQEYVNEQIRRGESKTVLFTKDMPEHHSATDFVPIADVAIWLDKRTQSAVKPFKFDPARVAPAVPASALADLLVHMQMVAPQQSQIDQRSFEEDFDCSVEMFEQANKDARRIEGILKKTSGLYHEGYRQLIDECPDPATTERMLTTHWSKYTVWLSGNGTPIFPVQNRVKSLISKYLHQLQVLVGAVDDFTGLASVRVKSVHSSKSQSIEPLIGRPVPMKFDPNRTEERHMLLIAQSSSAEIMVEVNARLGLGESHEAENLLTLRSVLPASAQSARLRRAKEGVLPLLQQLRLFGDDPEVRLMESGSRGPGTPNQSRLDTD